MSKKPQEAEPNLIIKLFRFLTNKTFFKNLLYMVIFLVIMLVGLNLYLRSYTNHGQKLTLPDFNDMHIDEAVKLAEDLSFQLIVNDSTQIVGKRGGLIINQNPKGDSKVKENRKVYVTTTKYLADKIRLSSLPELYGRDFEQKKKELSHMKINSRIKDYKYDAAEPDHILEVYYEGDLIVDSEGRAKNIRIDKGGTLDFILSKRSGLEISIPDLNCQTLASAQFFLEDGARLRMGKVTEEGEIEDPQSAYVVRQYPPYTEDGKMLIGNAIDVVISAEKPEDCN